MAQWPPGAPPSGFIVAPDGTVVPVGPQAPQAYAPNAYPPAYPPAPMAPHAYAPNGYAPPAYHLAPMPLPPPPIMVVSTVPVYPVAHPPPAYPPAHGYPEAYAPSPGYQHNAPEAQSTSRELAVRQSDNESELERQRAVLLGDPGYYGTMSLATSGMIMAAAIATVAFFVVPVGAVLTAASLASGVTGGVGMWLLRQRRRKGPKGTVDTETQLRVLALAARHKGRLTVTSTAQGLGISLEQAEQVLQSLARSNYVDAELEAETAVVSYVFREMSVASTPRLPSTASRAP